MSVKKDPEFTKKVLLALIARLSQEDLDLARRSERDRKILATSLTDQATSIADECLSRLS